MLLSWTKRKKELSDIDKTALGTFTGQLNEMLQLLKLAAGTDLTKVKTGISISPFIKLRLGDTLRVVIYHNERHLRQAIRAVNISGSFK